MRLCDKGRGVSGKHGEARQPARLFIHTCERHPALPGLQHPRRREGKTASAHVSRNSPFVSPHFCRSTPLLHSSSHRGSFVVLIDTLLKQSCSHCSDPWLLSFRFRYSVTESVTDSYRDPTYTPWHAFANTNLSNGIISVHCIEIRLEVDHCNHHRICTLSLSCLTLSLFSFTLSPTFVVQKNETFWSLRLLCVMYSGLFSLQAIICNISELKCQKR